MHIGFVGYSGGKFKEEDALTIIHRIFAQIVTEYKDKDIEIISGATALGIPNLVYREAVKLGFKTVGIMCKEGYDNPLFPVDKLIVEGDNWGDESETFLNTLDLLYRIGGGPQSLEECKIAKNKGIKVVEYELAQIKDERVRTT